MEACLQWAPEIAWCAFSNSPGNILFVFGLVNSVIVYRGRPLSILRNIHLNPYLIMSSGKLFKKIDDTLELYEKIQVSISSQSSIAAVRKVDRIWLEQLQFYSFVPFFIFILFVHFFHHPREVIAMQ